MFENVNWAQIAAVIAGIIAILQIALSVSHSKQSAQIQTVLIMTNHAHEILKAAAVRDAKKLVALQPGDSSALADLRLAEQTYRQHLESQAQADAAASL